jgi:hypothetical protein
LTDNELAFGWREHFGSTWNEEHKHDVVAEYVINRISLEMRFNSSTWDDYKDSLSTGGGYGTCKITKRQF